MITLYVDEFQANGTVGITTNMKKVLVNLLRLQKFDIDENSQLQDNGFNFILPVGRFVCFAFPKSDTEIELHFVDVRQNPDLLQYMANNHPSLTVRDRLVKVAEVVNASYQQNYYAAELLCEDLPL